MTGISHITLACSNVILCLDCFGFP